MRNKEFFFSERDNFFSRLVIHAPFVACHRTCLGLPLTKKNEVILLSSFRDYWRTKLKNFGKSVPKKSIDRRSVGKSPKNLKKLIWRSGNWFLPCKLFFKLVQNLMGKFSVKTDFWKNHFWKSLSTQILLIFGYFMAHKIAKN